MLTCEAAERLIARYVDGGLGDADRLALDAHTASCAACATAVRAQREVAGVLRGRRQDAPVDLVSRVSVQLDAEAGVFGLANWRAWTLGLAPVAAALMLAAYLGVGASGAATAQSAATAGDEWTPAAGAASVLMQPEASGDALLEAVLTGSAAPEGERDVR